MRTKDDNICVRLINSGCQIAATGSLSERRAVALLKARFAEVDGVGAFSGAGTHAIQTHP